MLVSVSNIAVFKLIRERFKLKSKDKLKVNLKHPAYYTLAQIAYVDNIYNMHRVPKNKYYKYLIRMYWIIDKSGYRNTKYIYSQYLVEV